VPSDTWVYWDSRYDCRSVGHWPNAVYQFRRRHPDGSTGPALAGRLCPRCDSVRPLDRDNFYIRPSGRAEYCVTCHTEYYQERARNRRAAQNPARLQFGVEIEYSFKSGRVDRPDRGTLAQLLREAGIDCQEQNYNHQVRAGWKIVPDASVTAGGELVSPPMRFEDGSFEQITKACDVLRAAGCTADSTCGLHVHLEVRGYGPRKIKDVYRTWYNNQETIDLTVARSRRDGRWCSHLTQSDMSRVEGIDPTENATKTGLARIDRYKNVNGNCYGRQGTLEIRLHQGTVLGSKIEHWVRFCKSTFTLAHEGVTDEQAGLGSLLTACRSHGLPEESVAFMQRRALQLSTPRGRRPEPEPAGVLNETQLYVTRADGTTTPIGDLALVGS